MYPLKKLRNTRILLSVPIIGSLFYNIPRFFEFKTSLVFWDGGTDYFRYRNDTNITDLYTVSSININQFYNFVKSNRTENTFKPFDLSITFLTGSDV